MRFLYIVYIILRNVDVSCMLIYLYIYIVNRTKYITQSTLPPKKKGPVCQIVEYALLFLGVKTK